jgi:hypothetical protein
MNFFRRLLRRPTHEEGEERVVASLTKSIERNPNQEMPYAHLLEAYEKKGDLDGTIAWLTKLVELTPTLRCRADICWWLTRERSRLSASSGASRLRRPHRVRHDGAAGAERLVGPDGRIPRGLVLDFRIELGAHQHHDGG